MISDTISSIIDKIDNNVIQYTKDFLDKVIFISQQHINDNENKNNENISCNNLKVPNLIRSKLTIGNFFLGEILFNDNNVSIWRVNSYNNNFLYYKDKCNGWVLIEIDCDKISVYMSGKDNCIYF